MKLRIVSCDMLTYWPEEEFRSLVSLKIIEIAHCSKLIGPTQVKGYCTRGKDQLLPNLQELEITCCESLTQLFVLPPSLTHIDIQLCDSLESILGQDDRELESLHHFDTASSSEHCSDLASKGVPEQSVSPRISPLPCLKFLRICGCKKLCFVSAQLDALIDLQIERCSGLETLNFGELPLLETLWLYNCKHLTAVPGSQGNYSALRQLNIIFCPAINMEPLYRCLEQGLYSLEHKDISYAGLSDPDEGTFHFPILRLVSLFLPPCLLCYKCTPCNLQFEVLFNSPCIFTFGNTLVFCLFLTQCREACQQSFLIYIGYVPFPVSIVFLHNKHAHIYTVLFAISIIW